MKGSKILKVATSSKFRIKEFGYQVYCWRAFRPPGVSYSLPASWYPEMEPFSVGGRIARTAERSS